MRPRDKTRSQEKVELMMTPMIDIVFQLLVFFIMTFKIVTPEGNFNIKMPLKAPSEGEPEELLPPMTVRLIAKENGELAAIRLNDSQVNSYDELRTRIRGFVGDDAGPSLIAKEMEVELDCDYNLRYVNVIDTITAISGYIKDGRIVQLIEKFKFSPQRGAG